MTYCSNSNYNSRPRQNSMNHYNSNPRPFFCCQNSTNPRNSNYNSRYSQNSMRYPRNRNCNSSKKHKNKNKKSSITEVAEAAAAKSIAEMKRFNEVDMPRWRSARRESIDTFRKCAAVMDNISKGTSIGKVTGGFVGFSGGVVAIVGMCLLNPVVFSIGATIAASGGVTSLSTTLAKAGFTYAKKKKTAETLKTDQKFHALYSKLHKDLQSNIQKLCTAWYVINSAKTGLTSFGAVNGLILAKNGMALLKDGTIIPTYLAEEVAKQLIYPGKIFGVISVEAFGVLSKVVVIGGSVLSVAAGIWDVFSGAKEIINGSDVAQEMRTTAQTLEEDFKKVEASVAATMKAITMK